MRRGHWAWGRESDRFHLGIWWNWNGFTVRLGWWYIGRFRFRK